MTKKLEGNPSAKRRFRRTSLRPRLVGLTAFSFTCLVFGAIVYAASIPTLTAVISYPDGQGTFASWLNSIPLNTLTTTNPNGASSDSVAPDSAQSANSAANASTASGGSLFSSSSVNAAGLGSITDEGSLSASDANQAGTSSGGTDSAGDSGGSAGNDTTPEVPSTPDEGSSSLDAETKLQYDQFYAALYNDLATYITEINTCTEEFNAQSLNKSIDTRRACSDRCDSLYERLFSQYAKSLNGLPLQPEYSQVRGNMAQLYRLLYSYVGCMQAAWTQNLAFADPSAHVAEFMEPLTSSSVDGKNKYLSEFETLYPEARP